MTSKLDKLQAQRRALDAAIKAAKGAMQKQALAERRKAMARAIDNAIRGGASVAEIEAALAALRGQKPGPQTLADGDASDGVDHV